MLSRAPVTHLSPATRFRSELGALLLLAIPVVLSELGWMAMSIVDTIMVGRLSPAAIGAVGISSAIFYTPALFGIGLLLGLDTLVAQAFGRGDFDDCHRALAQGVYLAIAVHPGRHAAGGLRAPSLSAAGNYRSGARSSHGNIFSCSNTAPFPCSFTSRSGAICRAWAR